MIDVLNEIGQSLFDFRIWLAILATSVYGASLGLINYYAGKKGVPAIQERFPQVNPDKLEHYHRWYERWGARVLILSSLPVLGTFLTLGAGIYGVHIVAFMVWSVIALLIRNWLLFFIFTVIIGSL